MTTKLITIFLSNAHDNKRTTMETSPSTDNNAIAAATSGSSIPGVIPESSSADDSSNSFRTPNSNDCKEVLKVDPETETEAVSRSTEKIMDKSRQAKKVFGGVGTDDEDTAFVTEDFANDAKKSAIRLQLKCWPADYSAPSTYKGQAFLLRDPITQAVHMVTCKHNIVSEKNVHTGKFEDCEPPHEMVVLAGDMDIHATIVMPNTGYEKTEHPPVNLRQGEVWQYGIDVSFGPVINSETSEACYPTSRFEQHGLRTVLEYLRPLDLVANDFKYTEGLKVGILVQVPGVDKEAFSEVSGTGNIPLDDKSPWLNAADNYRQCFTKVCGEEKDIMIYTGTILEVGEAHIEYDINTYQGCSGAAVIVVDQTHADFGKAIAVHAGYKRTLNANIGFKLLAVSR